MARATDWETRRRVRSFRVTERADVDAAFAYNFEHIYMHEDEHIWGIRECVDS